MSETTGLVAALAKVQAKLPNVGKSKTAEVTGETRDGRPFKYTYRYADLADIAERIHPRLSENGLAFIAAPRFHGDRYVLVGTLEHVSGQKVAGVFPLPPADRASPQQIGSAITYGRRYLLCSLTGVVADEDDDGAAASKAPPEKRAPAAKAKPKPGGQQEFLGAVNEARHVERHQAAIAAASNHAQLSDVAADVKDDTALSQASRLALRQLYDDRWKELEPEAAP